MGSIDREVIGRNYYRTTDWYFALPDWQTPPEVVGSVSRLRSRGGLPKQAGHPLLISRTRWPPPLTGPAQKQLPAPVTGAGSCPCL